MLAELRATEVRMATAVWAAQLQATRGQGHLATAAQPQVLWRPAQTAASRAEKSEKAMASTSAGGSAAFAVAFAARLAAQHAAVGAQV